jgi:hypothetical protein
MINAWVTSSYKTMKSTKDSGARSVDTHPSELEALVSVIARSLLAA